MFSSSHSLCCKSLPEERSAGNPHATFCGNRWQVTATDDPVGRPVTGVPIAEAYCIDSMIPSKAKDVPA